jgi:hypothetical protein
MKRVTSGRTRLRALLGAALCTTLIGGVAAVAPTTSAQAVSTWTSGVAGSGNTDSPASFATWRGASVPVVSNYIPRATWDGIANPTGVAEWDGLGYHMVWSVPMLPNNEGTIQIGATGAYNLYFISLAQHLVANGQGNADIRLGWEMNGSWYTWRGDKDPASYVAYWRQIVTAMRAVPGAQFTFNWSPANNAPKPAEPDYPGDAYVDEVGHSVYDQAWDVSADMIASRWDEIYNGRWGYEGMAWLSAFSKTHNKPIGVAEWGLSKRCDGHAGLDDPTFIQNMYNYFASNNMAYEMYYNFDPNTCEKHAINDGMFPKSAALYQKLWSSPGSKPLPAKPIYYSRSQDRSAPALLTGKIQAGLVYIYLVSPQAAVRVSFSLDKAKIAPKAHTESTPPWDFEGGPADAPIAFDLNTLKAGKHTMRITVTPAGGTPMYISSQFTLVKPPVPAPAPTK